MNYSEFLAQTLKSASQIANNNFGKVKGSTKGNDNNQVLTQTDLEIGKYIISQINKYFPEHNIIDEEAGVIDNKSDFTWVVDPIDGTSNFANGVPTYGIMVGLLENDIPIAGGIALPEFEKIITAEKGKGTFEGSSRLNVMQEKELRNVLVAYGVDGHQENPDLTYNELKPLGEIILNIRNLRSSNSVFDSIMVAEGRYGAFLNKTSKIWDNVSQQIIIEEAGGTYTDFKGNSMDYSNPLNKVNQNFTFFAGAPEIHSKISRLLKE